MTELHGERRDWSRIEVEATVAEYMDMLMLERRAIPFNKAERNRNLRTLLDDRSRGAVELKHQNISAILIELGLPYVEGYKPRRNYQELLKEAVENWVTRTPELLSLIQAEIEQVPSMPTVDDILRTLVERPAMRPDRQDRVRERPPRYTARRNYLLLEASNRALGLAGEEFVVRFEEARLLAAGCDRLANGIEQVSVTRGDHLGFDVLSFEEDGRDRLIEVKTTGFGAYTPFFVSRNELEISKREADRYNVYRVYAFRRDAKLFRLPGAVDQSCDLEAEQFVASVG